jgi:SAM-dependent methyltransferase
VGAEGEVLAQEIQPEFLERLRKRSKRLPNVRVVAGTMDDPRLPRRASVAVLLTVYHEVARPEAFLRRLREYLEPGGRLAVIDFDAGRRGYPPAPQGHQVSETAVLREARAAGWRLRRRHDFLSAQFFLVFEPDGLRQGARRTVTPLRIVAVPSLSGSPDGTGAALPRRSQY